MQIIVRPPALTIKPDAPFLQTHKRALPDNDMVEQPDAHVLALGIGVEQPAEYGPLHVGGHACATPDLPSPLSRVGEDGRQPHTGRQTELTDSLSAILSRCMTRFIMPPSIASAKTWKGSGREA